METAKKEEILIEGPEVAGLLVIPDKVTSFSRTNSFASKIILPSDPKEDKRKSFSNEALEDVGRDIGKNDIGSLEGSISGKSNVSKQGYTGWKRYLGMGLAIFSSAVFSLTVLIVKMLKGYLVSSIALWRFQGVLIPSIPLILHGLCTKRKPNVFEPIYPLCRVDKFKIFAFLFFRAFFGCGAVILNYNSLQYMQIGDATVIAFSTPVFVTFLAYFVLKEKCGVVNIVSAVLTFIGVTIIVRPPFLTGGEELKNELLIGAGLALGSMIFASFTFLVLRMLKGVHYSLTTLFFGFYGSIECLIFSVIAGSIDLPRDSWDWFLAISLAALTFIGQVATTLAFKYEEAGPIALCRTCDVIFSFIWQFVFLGVIPDVFSFVGSAVVMTGVFLVSFRKYVSMLPEKNGFRQKFAFVMK